ncbi:hypothetical protein TWF730_001015 [Orbilia blumenaviensis]|uniref:Uncharacterized protein n=1 Tax=Orbilia blumenaviensis TaxID=1796055 RepID=A0AAV9VPK0_9PEZI
MGIAFSPRLTPGMRVREWEAQNMLALPNTGQQPSLGPFLSPLWSASTNLLDKGAREPPRHGLPVGGRKGELSDRWGYVYPHQAIRKLLHGVTWSAWLGVG